MVFYSIENKQNRREYLLWQEELEERRAKLLRHS